MNWWRRWREAQQAQERARHATRWVVIDCETSGLDMAHDHVIAVAAVAVHWRAGRPQLGVADSQEWVLQCPPGVQLDEVARRNILLHGVGRGQQGQGLPPAVALQWLLDFVNGAPCLAFHARFDATMLARACHTHLQAPGPGPWLDLAPMARLLHPSEPHRHLDDWLTHFGLTVGQRHRASSDAWATAELLQCLWPAWRAVAGTQSPWAAAQALLRARQGWV